MEIFKIGDRVTRNNSNATQTGIIVGIWEKDEYLKEEVLFAKKGDYKVRFEDNDDTTNGFIPCSANEIKKI